MGMQEISKAYRQVTGLDDVEAEPVAVEPEPVAVEPEVVEPEPEPEPEPED